jgi:hypothetical protein
MVTSATDLSLRYDLDSHSTFDVLAGKAPSPQRRFTVHHNLFTQRSEFFRAARSSQWLTDPAKPVDLEDDDPEIVSAYLSFVYFGNEVLRSDVEEESVSRRTYPDEHEEDDKLEDAFTLSERECEKRDAYNQCEEIPYTSAIEANYLFLAKVYLQADKLQDQTTANLLTDEIIRFAMKVRRNPSAQVINYVYESTVHGSPLRKLMRDSKVYCTYSNNYLRLHAVKYHEDFCRDIAVEFLRVKDSEPSRCFGAGFPPILCANRCCYHVHDGPGAGSCGCSNGTGERPRCPWNKD